MRSTSNRPILPVGCHVVRNCSPREWLASDQEGKTFAPRSARLRGSRQGRFDEGIQLLLKPREAVSDIHFEVSQL
jgi:hypothetical protein